MSCKYRSPWSKECKLRYEGKPYLCSEEHCRRVKENDNDN